MRNELFEDRMEEEKYMEDQRNWSRNERDNGPRKLRRISELVTDESGDKEDKAINGEERAIIMQAKKTWAEASVDRDEEKSQNHANKENMG